MRYSNETQDMFNEAKKDLAQFLSSAGQLFLHLSNDLQDSSNESQSRSFSEPYEHEEAIDEYIAEQGQDENFSLFLPSAVDYDEEKLIDSDGVYLGRGFSDDFYWNFNHESTVVLFEGRDLENSPLVKILSDYDELNNDVIVEFINLGEQLEQSLFPNRVRHNTLETTVDMLTNVENEITRRRSLLEENGMHSLNEYNRGMVSTRPRIIIYVHDVDTLLSSYTEDLSIDEEIEEGKKNNIADQILRKLENIAINGRIVNVNLMVSTKDGEIFRQHMSLLTQLYLKLLHGSSDSFSEDAFTSTILRNYGMHSNNIEAFTNENGEIPENYGLLVDGSEDVTPLIFMDSQKDTE